LIEADDSLSIFKEISGLSEDHLSNGYSAYVCVPTDPSRLAVAALLSNDRANHRMSIISPPELQEDTDKKAHVKLHHVAFEYVTIDDLLNSYVLRSLEKVPTTTNYGQRSGCPSIEKEQ
jgi:hypothetical protein